MSFEVLLSMADAVKYAQSRGLLGGGGVQVNGTRLVGLKWFRDQVETGAIVNRASGRMFKLAFADVERVVQTTKVGE